MPAKQINVDPKEKKIDIFVDDTTVNEVKEILKHFGNLEDYEIHIHNPEQSTDLIDVYKGYVSIDNLYKVK